MKAQAHDHNSLKFLNELTRIIPYLSYPIINGWLHLEKFNFDMYFVVRVYASEYTRNTERKHS